MARPLRITYPGAIYHIINRGCRKDKIFRRIADREEFLERLTAASSKYGIIVHGYCLMNNHLSFEKTHCPYSFRNSRICGHESTLGREADHKI